MNFVRNGWWWVPLVMLYVVAISPVLVPMAIWQWAKEEGHGRS